MECAEDDDAERAGEGESTRVRDRGEACVGGKRVRECGRESKRGEALREELF